MDINKEKLINLFKKNVKGKKCNVSKKNPRHDGRKGHWLEEQFGVTANSDNSADLYGYELKNETTSKTTFGDWSANKYIYKDINFADCFKGDTTYEKQDSFCHIFGHPNPNKKNRYSWSGKPVPKIDGFNEFGQILKVQDNLDIVAVYSYSQDMRKDKQLIVPKKLQKDDLILAKWFGVKSPSTRRKDKCLKDKLEDKFNDKGWFTCKTDENGYYNEICFGAPFTYSRWIELVKKGIVYFDSGMYETNKRPYSQWRASNNFWDSQITERYK